MKKIIVLSLLTVILTGCVKQTDYDDLQKKYDKLQSKYEDLEEENDELRDEIKKLKEIPVVETAETTAETSDDTSKELTMPNVVTNPDGTMVVDVYNNTFTNPDSGSTISMLIYYTDDGMQYLSTYNMPQDSYFKDNYKAEAASALYSLFILEIDKSGTITANCQTDEYYGTTIFSNENTDTGYTFFAFDRKNYPCYSIDECDWFLEYQNDMDNKKYSSAETSWIIDCFNAVGEALTTYSNNLNEITKQIKEQK